MKASTLAGDTDYFSSPIQDDCTGPLTDWACQANLQRAKQGFRTLANDPKQTFHLYIDDTGSREPDRRQSLVRADGMDCFALGGILVRAEDIGAIFDRHREFCESWKIKEPLHSYKLRGGRGNFGWLRRPEKAAKFYPELTALIRSLPIISVAAVIDRFGYVKRYEERHQNSLWLMCKTAYSILIERAAKFARSQERQLEIYFENAGEIEDRNLVQYTKDLKKLGMPFPGEGAANYDGLSANDFSSIILGDAHRRTKETPMIQIADLVLYPVAKRPYDPHYPPYQELMSSGRLIENHLPPEKHGLLGTKYSCFERMLEKNEGPD